MLLGPTQGSSTGAPSGIQGFISQITPIIKVGTQIAGAVSQAVGINRQYQDAANVMDYNRAVYEQNASLIKAAAEQRKQIATKEKREYLSRMQARYGAAGVNLSGSPLLAMAESASSLELDIQNEEFNSLIEAQRAGSRADIYAAEASNYRKAGRNLVTASATGSADKFISQF